MIALVLTIIFIGLAVWFACFYPKYKAEEPVFNYSEAILKLPTSKEYDKISATSPTYEDNRARLIKKREIMITLLAGMNANPNKTGMYATAELFHDVELQAETIMRGFETDLLTLINDEATKTV